MVGSQAATPYSTGFGTDQPGSLASDPGRESVRRSGGDPDPIRRYPMNDSSAGRLTRPPRRLSRRGLLQTGVGVAAAMAGGPGGQAAAQDDRPIATPPTSPDAARNVTPARVALA